jgi:hypothetical protein
MQLKSPAFGKKCTRLALATATAALLAPTGAGAADRAPIEVESALLGYSEPQRVQAMEGVISARSEVREGRYLYGRIAFDVLTGASANGAVPSRGVQTFTRPSGGSQYSVQPGDTPLDNGFSDQRFAASIGYDRPLDRLSRWKIGAQGSAERDYLSLGLNTSVSRDFFERNTTLSFGISANRDQVKPLGGAPDPFSSMPTTPVVSEGEGEGLEGGGPGESKSVFDLNAGLTQVLGRNSLLRVNYAYDHASGYMTDPYNVLSVVGPAGSASAGAVSDVVFESRPGSRTQHAIYAELKRALGAHVADISYRFASNDWGTRSQTVELRYRHYLDPENYLQPHIRYYTQTAADFYHRYLIEGEALPANASADYRLADMKTSTFGLEYGHKLRSGRWFSAALEYYDQYSIGGGGDAFGALDGLDLYPSVSALTARIGVSGEW